MHSHVDEIQRCLCLANFCLLADCFFAAILSQSFLNLIVRRIILANCITCLHPCLIAKKQERIRRRGRWKPKWRKSKSLSGKRTNTFVCYKLKRINRISKIIPSFFALIFESLELSVNLKWIVFREWAKKSLFNFCSICSNSLDFIAVLPLCVGVSFLFRLFFKKDNEREKTTRAVTP